MMMPTTVLPFTAAPFHVEQFEGSIRELIHTRSCFRNPPLLVNLARQMAIFGDQTSCRQARARVVGTVVSDGLQPRIGTSTMTLPCARRPADLLGCEKSLTCCG